MHDWITIFFLTLSASLGIVIGASIASVEHIRQRWLEKELRHSITSFGGGLLIAAIALVLIPEGIRNLNYFLVASFFGMGGLYLWELIDI